jgi:hypothetical protein
LGNALTLAGLRPHDLASGEARRFSLGTNLMLVSLLAQTWRSVVSVMIAWILIILSLIYWPEALAGVIDSARGTRQWLLDLVGSRGSDTVDILAGAIITDHTVTMAFMFLFARIVVLTVILYIIGSIYIAMTGRQPAFMRH